MNQAEPLIRFLEESPLAVAAFDREMRCVAASPRWLEANGLTGASVAGRRYLDLIPDAPAAWLATQKRALEGAGAAGEEERWQRADGSVVWKRRAVQPWRSVTGEIVGFIVVCEEVTAKRAAEEAAAAQRARVRAILDTSPNAIITFGRDGRIEDANQAAETMFGHPREDLLGERLETLIAPSSRASLATYVEHCLRDDDARIIDNSIETDALRRDGGVFPIAVAIGEIDRLGRFTVNIADHSKRKAAEQALLASHAELEMQVRERTQALEAAKTKAEKDDAFKSRFLAAASHDLRQPLQSLGMYLAVLREQLELPEQREICEKMARSRDAVTSLLDALLDISRLDSGSIEPQRRDFALRPLLERVVATSLPFAAKKGLALHAQETDCVVHTDAALLERVLDNLVGNAIRYTNEGRVAIACEPTASGARIDVIDTGIGIPAAALERVFDEYYQLDNDTLARREGLGLGLSIVRLIANLLDHPIHVSSEVGHGSTFSITVPLGERAEETAGVEKNVRRASRVREPVVLLIDDEPAIVDATSMLLRAAGVTVHTACDGSIAQELLASGVRPDMVVCDYRLPGTNGVKLIRELRARVARDLPAILLTGDTSGREVAQAKLADCVVLHKPVDAERLLNAISRAVRLP